MGGIHEVSTDHGEDDGEAMLGRELHTLLELVFKKVGVETETGHRCSSKQVDAFTKNHY